jgi:hypothetical protein
MVTVIARATAALVRAIGFLIVQILNYQPCRLGNRLAARVACR